ncbi:MAG TPA: hypothetical protein VI299_26370 [Polyangiales bacterium]
MRGRDRTPHLPVATGRAGRAALGALFLAVLSIACSVRPVHADAGALLPIRAEVGVPAALRVEAEQAALRYFAMLPEPIPVTTSEDGLRRAGPRFRDCAEPTCASAYAGVLAIDLAVAIRLFAPDKEAPHGGLSVALVTREGNAFTGNVHIDDRGVEDATVRALGVAYERWRRGPGPWLNVDGPAGSRISVDGGPLTALPYVEKQDPGLHRVRVEDESGQELYSGSVHLPDDANHRERLHVEPAPVAAASTFEASTGAYWHRPRSRWNYWAGVPLVVAGVFYTAVGIAQFAARGDCAEEAGGRCVRQKTVNAGSRAALALGIAGIAVGGGLFMGAGLVREHGQPGSTGMLQLGGKF